MPAKAALRTPQDQENIRQVLGRGLKRILLPSYLLLLVSVFSLVDMLKPPHDVSVENVFSLVGPLMLFLGVHLLLKPRLSKVINGTQKALIQGTLQKYVVGNDGYMILLVDGKPLRFSLTAGHAPDIRLTEILKDARPGDTIELEKALKHDFIFNLKLVF